MLNFRRNNMADRVQIQYHGAGFLHCLKLMATFVGSVGAWEPGSLDNEEGG